MLDQRTMHLTRLRLSTRDINVECCEGQRRWGALTSGGTPDMRAVLGCGGLRVQSAEAQKEPLRQTKKTDVAGWPLGRPGTTSPLDHDEPLADVHARQRHQRKARRAGR
mgnify:CR=1 FL=1|jgi:hypothetical protein